MVLGSALDIVEHCGVPRYLFTDFPLGNPCGVPYDAAMQREIIRMSLALFHESTAPRTTDHAPYSWPDQEWKTAYMQVREEDLAALERKGEQRRVMLAGQRSDTEA